MLRRVFMTLSLLTLLAGCGSSATTATPSAVSAPIAAPSSASGQASAPAGSSTKATLVGQAFVEAVATGDSAGAVALESDTVLSSLTPEKLAQMWQGFVAKYGAFEAIGNVTTAYQPPNTVATVQVAFASRTVAMTVMVDDAGKVAGFNGPAS